jgi:hypothetical protein
MDESKFISISLYLSHLPKVLYCGVVGLVALVERHLPQLGHVKDLRAADHLKDLRFAGFGVSRVLAVDDKINDKNSSVLMGRVGISRSYTWISTNCS